MCVVMLASFEIYNALDAYAADVHAQVSLVSGRGSKRCTVHFKICTVYGAWHSLSVDNEHMLTYAVVGLHSMLRRCCVCHKACVACAMLMHMHAVCKAYHAGV